MTESGPAMLCLGCITTLRARGHVVTHSNRLPENRAERQRVATWAKGMQ